MLTWKPRLRIYQSSTRKNTFDIGTFQGRSYSHWLYVMKIKDKVIFNNYRYSVTTNKHQYEMIDFLREELGIKHNDIIFVNQHDSLSFGIQLDSFYKKLYLAEMRVKTKGKKESYYTENQNIINEMKLKIATLKKLGGKPVYTLKQIKKDVVAAETYRLDKAREKSRAAREKRKVLITEHKTSFESLDSVNV